jgi:hypothetical protein
MSTKKKSIRRLILVTKSVYFPNDKILFNRPVNYSKKKHQGDNAWVFYLIIVTCNPTLGKIYYNNLVNYILLPYFFYTPSYIRFLVSIYYRFFFPIETQAHLWICLSFSWLDQLKIRKKKTRAPKIILTHIHTSSRSYCL